MVCDCILGLKDFFGHPAVRMSRLHFLTLKLCIAAKHSWTLLKVDYISSYGSWARIVQYLIVIISSSKRLFPNQSPLEIDSPRNEIFAKNHS